MDTNKKYEVRSGRRFEFEPATEAEIFLQNTINKHYLENGFASSEYYVCGGSSFSVGLMKTPEMTEKFDAFCTSLIEKLSSKMEEYGYKMFGPNTSEHYAMLCFVHKSKVRQSTPNEELQNDLERILTEEYNEYGFESSAKVVVDNEKEVEVWFNSEKPYLGMHFWLLLSKTEVKLRTYLETKGYKYQKSEWLYDFWIMHFEYQA